MLRSRSLLLLLFLLSLLSKDVTGQHQEVQSMKLYINYETENAGRDSLELYDEAAENFDIADFLAKNNRTSVQLSGSYLSDHELIHFGYDSELYTDRNKACGQFCLVEKSIRRAPLFGVVTTTTSDFEGEEITRILEGSAAERADLRPGDIILSIDAYEMRSGCDLTKAIANETEVGDTILVEIERNGGYALKEVILGFTIKKIMMWQPCCQDNPPKASPKRQLHLFPNPTADFTQFHFQSEDERPFRFILTDVAGRVLLEQQIDQFNGRYQDYLDLSNFPSGMYFFTIVQGKYALTQRLALQKL